MFFGGVNDGIWFVVDSIGDVVNIAGILVLVVVSPAFAVENVAVEVEPTYVVVGVMEAIWFVVD